MNIIEKSESIRADLRKDFQDGTSKTAQHRCYGYDTGPDGGLAINPDEAAIVRWIFNATSAVTVWAKLPLGWRNKASPPPLENQSGIVRQSTR